MNRAPLLVLGCAACSPIAGRWDAKCSTTSSGAPLDIELTFHLRDHGNLISGDCAVLRGGGIWLDGTAGGILHGEEFLLTCSLTHSGYTWPINFSGDLSEDPITGWCDASESGYSRRGTGTFTRR